MPRYSKGLIPALLLLPLLVAYLPSLQAQCVVCADGSSFQFPDAIYDADTGVTCSDYEAQLASYDAESIECGMELAFLAILYPISCGYCSLPAEADVCTLCNDGSMPTLPAETEVADFGLSCGALAYMVSLEQAGTENCTSIQSMAGSCGCSSGIENPCSLCADGSPIPDPNAVSSEGISCSDLEGQGLMLQNDSEECEYLQSFVITECGCPPLEDACPFCPDGNPVPDPGKQITGDSGETCGEYELYSQITPEGTDICDGIQFTGMFECGCNYVAPTEAECVLCSDGSPIPNPALSLVQQDGVGVTCGMLEYSLAFGEDYVDKECTVAQAILGPPCGCTNSPEPSCDVCPASENFEHSKMVVNPLPDSNETEVPCFNILFELSLDQALCSEYKDSVATLCCISSSGETDPTLSPVEAPVGETDPTPSPVKAPVGEIVPTPSPVETPVSDTGGTNLNGTDPSTGGECDGKCRYDGCHRTDLAIPSRCDSAGTCWHGDLDSGCAGIADFEKYPGMVGFLGAHQPSFCLLDRSLGPLRVAICPPNPNASVDEPSFDTRSESSDAFQRFDVILLSSFAVVMFASLLIV